MAVYLVDFENVGSNGLQGVPELTEDEKVIVFFSDKADSISIDVHRHILESDGSFEFIKVQLGQRNALDFQLASYLGYLIGTEPEKHYCVVSKDFGFKPLVDFWRKHNNNLSLIMTSSIQQFKEGRMDAYLQTSSSENSDQISVVQHMPAVHTAVFRASVTKQQSRQSAQPQSAQPQSAQPQSAQPQSDQVCIGEEEVLAVVPDFAGEAWLSDIIRFINASQTRADLYNRIRAKFGQDRGCLIYNKVKRFK